MPRLSGSFYVFNVNKEFLAKVNAHFGLSLKAWSNEKSSELWSHTRRIPIDVGQAGMH